MVVDGQAEFVGSSGLKAAIAIKKAAARPKARITLGCRLDAGYVAVPIQIDAIPDGAGEADVLLAVTENGLASNVTRGENTGSTLRHRAVVRRLDVVGTAKSGGYQGEPRVKLEKQWRRGETSVVIFVQERASRRVLGSAKVAANCL